MYFIIYVPFRQAVELIVYAAVGRAGGDPFPVDISLFLL